MSNTAIGETERVVMGAVDVYVAPYESGEINCEEVAVEANLAGNTQGGTTVTFTPTTYTIKDDRGRVRRTFMTEGDAEIKTGLLTFTAKTLAAMQSVGQVSDVAASASARGKTVVKLGGGKSALKRFVVVCVYTDDETRFKTYIGMIATNTSPLSLAFTKDKETVVELTFKAESNGVDDTILVIEEETAEKTA